MLSIDISLIAVFLIVWILSAILSKVFFNPLRKVIGEREAKINKNRRAAEKTMQNFEQTSLQIEERVRGARALSQATKKEFEQKGLLEKERILGEANKEWRREVEKAKDKLKRQLESLKKELESRSKDFAQRIEQKLLD